jgi:hypothetical protein
MIRSAIIANPRSPPPPSLAPPPPQVNMSLITMLAVLLLAAVGIGARQITWEYVEGLDQHFTHFTGGHGLTNALLPDMFCALVGILPGADGGLGSFSTLNTWKQDHVHSPPVQALYAGNPLLWDDMLTVLAGIMSLTAHVGGRITNQIMRVSNPRTRTDAAVTACTVLGGVDTLASLADMGVVLGSTFHYDVPVGAWGGGERGAAWGTWRGASSRTHTQAHASTRKHTHTHHTRMHTLAVRGQGAPHHVHRGLDGRGGAEPHHAQGRAHPP